MIYGSVCSGIEAATVAWEPLGWQPAWFAEIDSFCSSLLKHHYPKVHNHGDFTQIPAGSGPVDVLVGGTPCQSFSVAGLRGGLADARGNLALEFLKLAQRLRPRWLLWENVPGMLSSLSHESPDPREPEAPVDLERDGQEVETEDEYVSEELHAFNCFLAGLAELGYGWAYRVLDAQHFGVPQRRRRVFVVGYLGDWRPAAAVLLERHSLSGDTPPRREAGQGTAASTARGIDFRNSRFQEDGLSGTIQAKKTGGYSLNYTTGVAMCLNGKGGLGRIDGESETFIPTTCPTLRAGGNRTGGDRPPGTDVDTCDSLIPVAQAFDVKRLRADGFDASEDGSGRGTPLVPVERIAIAFDPGKSANLKATHQYCEEFCPPLIKERPPAIAFSCKDHGADAGEVAPTLRSMSHDASHANAGGQVASQSGVREVEAHATLDSNNGSRSHNGVVQGMAVRRLTVVECARLQGFPDTYCHITRKALRKIEAEEAAYLSSHWLKVMPHYWQRRKVGKSTRYRLVKGQWCTRVAADGPMYKALGNSMAVPVMRWIGERIEMVEEALKK